METVDDASDAFPNDASETLDTDGDGVGNNADTDDDGDGYPDSEELAAGYGSPEFRVGAKRI